MSIQGMRAFSATNWLRPPDSMMSARASRSIAYICRGVMSSIMCASSPMISLIFSLSPLVDFFTEVPTTSSPASCSALTTDQLFTPPVISSTRLPARRSRQARMRSQARASSAAISASVRSFRSAGAPCSTSSRAISRSVVLMSPMP